jgi:hypothetical protein
MTPNMSQTMKHTVKASVLTTSTEIAFALWDFAMDLSLFRGFGMARILGAAAHRSHSPDGADGQRGRRMGADPQVADAASAERTMSAGPGRLNRPRVVPI